MKLNRIDLERFLDNNMPNYVKDLQDLVSIPSISSIEGNYDVMDRILVFAGMIATKCGFDKPNIHTTKGYPILISDLKTDVNKPTIIIYNHMDVKPGGKGWDTNPFEPVVSDGKVIGRGSTDDKGPALAILYAINFLRTQNYNLPNIKLLYETEEEKGSPNFGSFLDENLDTHLLKDPNAIIVSDTIFEGEHPAITYRLRGLLRVEATLRLGKEPVHSGLFGGLIENPANIINSFLATCYDAKNKKITIPYFHTLRTIIPPSELEYIRDKILKAIDLKNIKKESGRDRLTVESPLEAIIKNWYSPSFESVDIETNERSEGLNINTIIPSYCTARFTMRLGPGQPPEKVLELITEHAKRFDERIQIRGRGSRDFSTDITNPYIEAAKESCLYGYGKEPLLVESGGTIGALSELKRVYPDKPIVPIAMSLLSDGYHKPNEKFEIEQARRGIKVFAHYLHSICKM